MYPLLKKGLKKTNKKAQSIYFKAIKSSTSSGDIYEYPSRSKAQKSAKGRNVETTEDSPTWGIRMKNLSTYPPHTPPPSDNEDAAEFSIKEVDATPIVR